MQVNPYLTFNGQCEAAFKFYEQNLGGTIQDMMPHAGTPMANLAPAGWGDKILHATIKVAGQVIMGSDAPPSRYRKPEGFMVSLSVDSLEEAERIYRALEQGGVVEMPLAQTFWAERFAMLTDQFGTPWIINYEKPA